jgi:hypothetical protein
MLSQQGVIIVPVGAQQPGELFEFVYGFTPVQASETTPAMLLPCTTMPRTFSVTWDVLGCNSDGASAPVDFTMFDQGKGVSNLQNAITKCR